MKKRALGGHQRYKPEEPIKENPIMSNPQEHVMDLIFRRWRSQTLYAGVRLGVFDIVSDDPAPVSDITDSLDIDAELGYRLLRALGSLDVLTEGPDRTFSLTSAGEFLQSNHPATIRGVTLLEEGPTRYALWPHLTDLNTLHAWVHTENPEGVFHPTNPDHGSGHNH